MNMRILNCAYIIYDGIWGDGGICRQPKWEFVKFKGTFLPIQLSRRHTVKSNIGNYWNEGRLMKKDTWRSED
jgi:hypothetical protein